jgi:DNA-damage-inducible protein J
MTISAQVDSKIEEEATAVLAAIALTPSDAFRLLITRVAKEQSFPQELFVPNAETISALEDVESGRVTSFTNLQEFMDDLQCCRLN